MDYNDWPIVGMAHNDYDSPALEFGAAWIKFKIEISIHLNFAGLFSGHLLKCCVTVVSL